MADETKTCPDCAETVKAVALICRFCQHDFRWDTAPRSGGAAEGAGRPVAVAVACWLLIGFGGISLLTSTLGLASPQVRDLMKSNPLPMPVQYGMLFGGISMTIVCAIVMLQGHNWARLLYVVWSSIGSVIGLATSPMRVWLIPSMAIFVVFVVLLFLPGSNEYFRRHGAKGRAQPST